jgi:V8-like Glu-specific endopeptidase
MTRPASDLSAAKKASLTKPKTKKVQTSGSGSAKGGTKRKTGSSLLKKTARDTAKKNPAPAAKKKPAKRKRKTISAAGTGPFIRLRKLPVVEDGRGRIVTTPPRQLKKTRPPRATRGLAAAVLAGEVHLPELRTPIDDFPLGKPWTALVYITGEIDTPGGRARISGTGFFLHSQIIVTAGHVLLDREFGEPQLVQNIHVGFAPDRFALQGPLSPVQIKVPQQWEKDGDTAYDIGVILLPQGFEAPYTLPVTLPSDAELENPDLKVIVAGFPGDKPDGELWAAMGAVRGLDPLRLLHFAMTTKGESGGPVIAGERDDPRAYAALGIHNYGGDFNTAARFTPALVAALEGLVS